MRAVKDEDISLKARSPAADGASAVFTHQTTNAKAPGLPGPATASITYR
jgi:hypothetical protein